jgi:hypothetical protein
VEFNENISCCIIFALVIHPPSAFECPNMSVYVSGAVVQMGGAEGRCGCCIDLTLGVSSVLKMSAAGL